MKARILPVILAFFIYCDLPVYAQQSSLTDEIVVKATKTIVFEMTANMKLTQDQISAARSIIADNIAKVRNLQQSLEDGKIDSKEMYDQRQQLTNDENRELSSVLTPDQMKEWMNLQDE